MAVIPNHSEETDAGWRARRTRLRKYKRWAERALTALPAGTVAPVPPATARQLHVRFRADRYETVACSARALSERLRAEPNLVYGSLPLPMAAFASYLMSDGRRRVRVVFEHNIKDDAVYGHLDVLIQ